MKRTPSWGRHRPLHRQSRGDLNFKTRHLYPCSSVVHIAVPFAAEAPQAPAIFVAAPASSMWHHRWIRTLSLRHHLRAMALLRLSLSSAQ
jgi:hypothetical protein